MRVQKLLVRSILVLLCSAVVSACSVVPQDSALQPPVVAVRNSTDRDIQEVAFTSAVAEGRSAVSGGVISPLPRGVAQYLGRTTNALRLPQQGQLRWLDDIGRVETRDVSLAETLENSTGEDAEMLVFDFQPGGQVQIMLESAPNE